MHLPAMRILNANGEAAYAGVCDLNRPAAESYAHDLGAASAHTDLHAMIDQCRPDGVILLIKPEQAPGVISQAIARKVPFFTEKPPSTDTATHRRLIKEAGDLLHVVGYNRRHSPYIMRAKEWMHGQQIQSVTCMFSRHHRREPDFSATAVHGIDTAYDLTGDTFVRARAEMAPAGTVWNYFINGWTKSGIRVDILVTPNTASCCEHYIIRGIDRTAVVAFPQIGMIDDPGYVELHEWNKVVSRSVPKDFQLAPDDHPGLGGIVSEHRAFIETLRSRKPAASTLATTLQTQQIREALCELVSAGKPGMVDVDFAS